MINTKNLGIDLDDFDEEKQERVADEMLVRDTTVALAVDSKFLESFYLVKITEKEKEDVEDRFSHVIKKGMTHLQGVFSERKFDSD